ncbi:MAG: hypothetical protein IIB38_14710 [Candidatus Hydrogenedentes bacterium]|nr:hypothetical protein [Candidatus Hydrogenedentota bacterium]
MTALYTALSESTSREELIDLVLEGRVEIDRLREAIKEHHEWIHSVSHGHEASVNRLLGISTQSTNEHGDGDG